MLTPEPCFGTDHSRRSPASGPLQGTAGKEVAENVVSNPPRGRPFGGGGVHPTGLRGSLLHRGEFYNFTAHRVDYYQCHSIKNRCNCRGHGSMFPVPENYVTGQMVFLP